MTISLELQQVLHGFTKGMWARQLLHRTLAYNILLKYTELRRVNLI